MEMEIEREEGEMSDTEMYAEDVAAKNEDQNVLLFKRDQNGLIIEQLEKIDAFKFEERARRFGVSLTGNKVITQKQIDELYYNFGIKDGNERHFRFDTLYLTEVDGLTTKDIFEYLKDYKPVAIEWIDDNSCNIVCQDHISVALALLIHSHEINNDTLKEVCKKSPYHLRVGIPHSKKDLIFMRFSTNGDKKITKKKLYEKQMEEFDKESNLDTKNPWEDLCRSWGVYDHQEIFSRKLPTDSDENDNLEVNNKIQLKNKRLAMRLGKRRHKSEEPEESLSESEWRKKSKTPRMRMRADDEECKLKRPQIESSDEETNSYAPLSIEVINTRSTNYTPRPTLKLSEKFKTHTQTAVSPAKKSVRSRLGAKVTLTLDNSSSDDSASDHSDYNIMSRVQRVTKNNSINSSNSVWSRLELKTNNSDTQNDLRQKLKLRKQRNTDDLRDVLSKTKQSNLRIEVDNNYINK